MRDMVISYSLVENFLEEVFCKWLNTYRIGDDVNIKRCNDIINKIYNLRPVIICHTLDEIVSCRNNVAKSSQYDFNDGEQLAIDCFIRYCETGKVDTNRKAINSSRKSEKKQRTLQMKSLRLNKRNRHYANNLYSDLWDCVDLSVVLR